MRNDRLVSIVWVLGAVVPAQAAQGPQRGCEVCHGFESREFERGIHVAVDVGCTTCHGGDPDTNDQERAHEGLRSLRDARESVESCASCHADPERMRGYGLSTEQLGLYWTSAHGSALAEEGDPNVATCVDCHGSHGVLPASDPRSRVHELAQVETCGRCHSDQALMAPYELDASVVDDYRASVHGVALLERGVLSSPACTDCHGSHGALPPRVSQLGRVCGSCHAVVRDSFELSPHADAVRDGLIDECTSCHSHHAIRHPSAAMLVGDGAGHCGKCHRGEDDPAARVGSNLFAALGELDSGIAEAERRLREAGERGLFLSAEKDYLVDVRELRSRARTLTHALSEERLDDLLNRGRAMIAQTNESVDVRERGLRDRKIFTGVFLAVALLLASVLVNYRREALGTNKKPRAANTGEGDG